MQIFILFFLLLVYHTLCCCAQIASKQEINDKSFELFNNEKVKYIKSKKSQAPKEDITVKNIKKFSLVATEELMMTLVGATEGNDDINMQVNLLAKYTEITKKDNWGEEAIQNINTEDKWKVQLVTEEKPLNNKYFVGITLVAHKINKKIFVFALTSTTTIQENQNQNKVGIPYKDITVTLFVGTFSDEESQPNSKLITWEMKESSTFSKINGVENALKAKYSELLIYDVFSFLTHENNVVLLLKGKIKNDNKKTVIVFINVIDSENKMKFLHIDAIDGCNPHLFPWDNKIFMITTDCKSSGGDSVKVMESTTVEKWVDSTGDFFRLGDLLKDKRDFTPTTIGSNVLLFTEQQNDEEAGTGSGKKHKYYLFISDGTRVKKIGVVAKDVESDEPIRLLFTEGELFTLHQISKNGDHKSLFLTRQQKLLTIIKETVSAWSNADNIIKKPCTSPSERSTLCINELPKDGVVGFLSNSATGTDNKKDWHDEYHYVNADVENGKQINNGFKFAQADAKVRWLIGNPKETMSYNFADLGFTLVATVTFEKSTEKNQEKSVLGVTTGKNKNSVGVFCLEEMFAVNSNIKLAADKKKNKKCVVEKQYQMALVYNDSKVCAYVDWEPLGDGQSFVIDEESKKNLQIYFGAHSKEGNTQIGAAHMTVTNVLLYNRPFTETELQLLKIHNNKKNDNSADLIPTISNENISLDGKDDNSDPETPDINADENDRPKDTLTTQINTKENDSLRSENSAINFSIYVNVITLSLLIVCVFTFAGHYV